MASIGSVINASSIYAYEAQQSAPKQTEKPASTPYNPTDTVHLSKAALAAISGSSDADNDGDSV